MFEVRATMNGEERKKVVKTADEAADRMSSCLSLGATEVVVAEVPTDERGGGEGHTITGP